MNSPQDHANHGAAPRGFMVLHGNRLEDLRDLLVHYLRAHPLPPLQPEIILLQSNGMKHWLELALANDGALGICAATRMELPSSSLWQLYRAVLGGDAVPAHMPFDKTALLWRLVRLLPRLCDTSAVYAPLQRYLRGDNAARKRYQLALQIADVFDAYQSYRADWLADWALGHDRWHGPGGAPAPLPSQHLWQAQLWRDLRADVGAARQETSRASVHARFMAALETLNCSDIESVQCTLGLPQRLIVFGVSSLSMQAVQALAGLGRVCQVLMLVQNPCQYYWGDIVEGHAALRQQLRARQPGKPRGESGTPPGPQGHPLLASWGKQGRDYLHLLDGFDAPESYRAHWSRVDVFVDPAAVGQAAGQVPSQLAQLQSAILHLNPVPEQPVPQADDGTLVFVSAHSAQRELEVLHDRLLAWFDADPQRQPREVMVMVPDMEAFAPLIHAVFGRHGAGQPGHIPYSVADTTARQSPLVQALAQLLALPTARLTLAEWLALFEVPAVRQRFGLDEPGVQQIQAWLEAAGVRWGLDASHRLAWGVPAGAVGLAQNTWDFGLRRLLLGYALGSTPSLDVGAGLWHDTLAQPGVSGLDAPLVAALVDWLDATAETLVQLQGEHTPAIWCQTLRALVARFFAPTDDASERALARLLAPLEAWSQACDTAGLDDALPLDVVREHWLAQIDEPALQQRFFGGGVQFGTLMPMRAIPFALICLLGMNDGAYPRAQGARDFDLMAASWRAGDRSRREDDRYLFLEAVLSARHMLYLSWQGHSSSDNSKRPPSVLVAQLLDHVNACWSPARQPQVQPLQPFSAVYFEARSGFTTYAKDWEPNRALALINKAQVATQSESNLCVQAPTKLTLADLQRLLRQPVEVFFRSRLQVEFDRLDDLEQQDEPFALDGLQQHLAGQTLLAAGADAQALRQLQAAGGLPLAGFGQKLSAQLQAKAQTVLQLQAPWRARYPSALPAMPIELTLADGMGLSGTLDGLWCQAEGAAGPCLQVAARTGKVFDGEGDARVARLHVLVGLWLRHLAGNACGIRLHSVMIGIDGAVSLAPLAMDEARTALGPLAQVWREAWRAPLPVACKTAWAYLLAQRQNVALLAAGKPAKDAHEPAQTVFDGGYFGGERDESAYLQRAFDSYDALRETLPPWAQCLYGPVLVQLQRT